MSEPRDENVRNMLQVSGAPRAYFRLPDAHVTSSPHEPTGENLAASNRFNERVRIKRESRNGCQLPDDFNRKNGVACRKNGCWTALRRTFESPRNGVASDGESDDSGLSSTTALSVYGATNKNGTPNVHLRKSFDNLSASRLNNDYRYFHFGRVMSSTPRLFDNRDPLVLHNKKRQSLNKIHAMNRGAPFVRSPYVPNFQHYPHCIAPDRFLMKAHLIQVRDAPTDLLNGSEWDVLSQDIWHKFTISQQTEEIFRKKMELWRYLYISIKGMFPRYSLYLVGSTISGFGSQSSDMDLCLLVKHPEPGDSRLHALHHLNTIFQFIRSKDILFSAELIQAKVPILKFCDNRFFLEVDLNCNNVVGIRNTHLLYCYSQLDWRVRPLVLIVKLWAQHHNINDAKNKTISSYSLVLMVLHYLQCGTYPAVLPCLQKEYPDKFSIVLNIYNIDLLEEMPEYRSRNKQCIGELLYGFLQYYTNFEYSKYAISVRTGNLLNIEECRAAHRNELHQWKLLCVEEPFDLSNTARSVYDPDIFNHIKSVFRTSKDELEKSLQLSSLLSRSSLFEP